MLMTTNIIALVIIAGVFASSCRSTPKSLTVSELVVVDPKGVVRARIGGSLPNMLVVGQRMARSQQAAGLLLYDETGVERGAYVTYSPSRNVALTLDNTGKQAATFAAGPDAGAGMRLRLDDDVIDIRVDEDGPSLHANRRRKVVFHEPPVEEPQNTQWCAALTQAKTTTMPGELLAACRERASEAACEACLGK
jgi:hypothetical protein